MTAGSSGQRCKKCNFSRERYIKAPDRTRQVGLCRRNAKVESVFHELQLSGTCALVCTTFIYRARAAIKLRG